MTPQAPAIERLAQSLRVNATGSRITYPFRDDIVEAAAELTRQQAEIAALREALEQARQEIINTPETADFMAGVPLEAAHQRERWDAEHDAGKSAFDWFWLIGYLAQKAATSAHAGDTEKAKHHTISTAAALANWHAALSGKNDRMRPGIGPGNGAEGAAHQLAAALNPAAKGDAS